MNDPLNINYFDLKIPKNHAVFMGCSFTRGIGVEPNQRYSALMCKEIDCHELNLSDMVLNNYKIFDIFPQLDFQSTGNVMVLQLTELSRIQVYSDKKPMLRYLSNQPSREYLTVYHDQFLIFELVKNLRWFVQLCRLKQIKLIIWSTARLEHSLQLALESYLGQYPEYVYLSSNLNEPDSYRVDNGTDGTNELGTGHPGPKSHQLIAQKLLNHYRKLYT